MLTVLKTKLFWLIEQQPQNRPATGSSPPYAWSVSIPGGTSGPPRWAQIPGSLRGGHRMHLVIY